MKKVYISGPMTGYEGYNFDAFDDARDMLKSLGFKVFNPADMDRTFEPFLLDNISNDDKKRFIRRDVHILLNEMNAEDGDFVVTLPGWGASVGAQAEVALARWAGMKVVYIGDVE